MEHPFKRPQPGKWASAVFSVLMHAVLVAALFWGMQWQHRAPEPVSVALVRAEPAAPTPRAAPEPQPEPEPVKEAPKPAPVVEKAPEPKPAPKPDIALKQPEKKPEPPKPEKKPDPKPEPKPEKKPEPKPEKKPEPKPEPKPQMTDMERLLNREQQRVREANDHARAAQESAALNARLDAEASLASRGRAEADWIARISQKVRSNLILPPGVAGNPKLVFRIQLLPTGEVLGEPRLVSNTGNAALEEAVRRAILKSSPLPKPEKNEVFQRDLNFTFFPTQNQ
ncbi:MAG: energy transducer TonB [Candidatus Dactylopiibacterium sp.]|nr:energy transducer TonB [Candidatus Dactylopiibacterium sp.]